MVFDPTGWGYKCDLTVRGGVAGLSAPTVGNIKPQLPAELRAVAAYVDLRDVRAVDPVTMLELPYGFESAANGITHVRHTIGTGDTVIRFYAGNAAASDAQNKANVSQDFAGYWPLGDASSPALDWTVNGNDGTQSGGVTFGATGKIGDGCSFDGADDCVDFGTSPLFEASATELTVLFWVKADTDDFNGSGKVLLDTSTWNVSSGGIWIALDDRGGVRATDGVGAQVKTTTGASGRDASVDNIFTTSPTWRHVAVRYSPSSLRMFVDGTDQTTREAAAVAGTGNYSPKNANCFIAAANDGSTNALCTLDTIAILPTALTADQILLDSQTYPGSAVHSWGAVEALASFVPYPFSRGLRAGWLTLSGGLQ